MESKLQMSRRMKFLILLTYYKRNKLSNFSDFERFLGYETPQPDIRQLLDFLIEKEILIFYDKIYNIKRYKLNTKKLYNYIKELESYQMFYKLIDTKYTIIPL